MAETRIFRIDAFDDKNIYNQWKRVHENLSKIYIEEYKEYVENVEFIK